MPNRADSPDSTDWIAAREQAKQTAAESPGLDVGCLRPPQRARASASIVELRTRLGQNRAGYGSTEFGAIASDQGAIAAGQRERHPTDRS
jgi:hypothetical protein